MKKLLLSSLILLGLIVACKTTKITQHTHNNKSEVSKIIGFIDYCAIKDSVVATRYYQNYYHNELRPKTKILMDNRPIQDSLVKFWKDKGFRVVTMQMQSKPYVIDSCKYISSALFGKVDDIFRQRFKDSLFSVTGKELNPQEINILITQRKKGIRCKN